MATMLIDRETVEAAIRELGLVSEGEECDHAVSICWCGYRLTEHLLKLALIGQRDCSSCGGDGKGDETPEACDRCGGSGEESIGGS